MHLHIYEIFIYDKEGKTMQYNGEKTSSSIDAVGETIQLLKESLDYHFTSYEHKLKMDQRLNVRSETIKLLEENIANILFDISLSNIFWICPFSQGKKKWDYIKLKTFYRVKESSNSLLNGRRYLQMIYS